MPWKESLINLPVHTLFQSVYAPGRVSYQSTCAHALSKRLCPVKSLLSIYLCTRSFKASMPWKESLINLPVHTLFQSVYALERASYQFTCAHALSTRLCPGKSLLLIYLCTRSFKASMPRKESLTNLPVHTLFQSVYAPERVSY